MPKLIRSLGTMIPVPGVAEAIGLAEKATDATGGALSTLAETGMDHLQDSVMNTLEKGAHKAARTPGHGREHTSLDAVEVRIAQLELKKVELELEQLKRQIPKTDIESARGVELTDKTRPAMREEVIETPASLPPHKTNKPSLFSFLCGVGADVNPGDGDPSCRPKADTAGMYLTPDGNEDPGAHTLVVQGKVVDAKTAALEDTMVKMGLNLNMFHWHKSATIVGICAVVQHLVIVCLSFALGPILASYSSQLFQSSGSAIAIIVLGEQLVLITRKCEEGAGSDPEQVEEDTKIRTLTMTMLCIASLNLVAVFLPLLGSVGALVNFVMMGTTIGVSKFRRYHSRPGRKAAYVAILCTLPSATFGFVVITACLTLLIVLIPLGYYAFVALIMSLSVLVSPFLFLVPATVFVELIILIYLYMVNQKRAEHGEFLDIIVTVREGQEKISDEGA